MPTMTMRNDKYEGIITQGVEDKEEEDCDEEDSAVILTIASRREPNRAPRVSEHESFAEAIAHFNRFTLRTG